MKNKSFCKLNIFFGFICIILIAVNVYVIVFYGRVPDYWREMLDVFVPRFAANEYIDESSPTDSLSFRRFKLNKNEIEQVEADIESNDVWHKATEDDKKLINLFPENSDTYRAIQKIDLENCYIAVYNIRDNCFTTDYDYEGTFSTVAVVYDKENSMYYYFELIW